MALLTSKMFENTESEEIRPPITKEAAVKVKQDNPPLDVWRMVRWQGYGLLTVASLVLMLARDWGVVASLLWGGVSVLVPGALFARAIKLNMSVNMHPGLGLIALAKWELLKIVLTIGLLLVSPLVIKGLNWLVLLAGFVLTMKLYWFACYWVIKSSNRVRKTNRG